MTDDSADISRRIDELLSGAIDDQAREQRALSDVIAGFRDGMGRLVADIAAVSAGMGQSVEAARGLRDELPFLVQREVASATGGLSARIDVFEAAVDDLTATISRLEGKLAVPRGDASRPAESGGGANALQLREAFEAAFLSLRETLESREAQLARRFTESGQRIEEIDRRVRSFEEAVGRWQQLAQRLSAELRASTDAVAETLRGVAENTARASRDLSQSATAAARAQSETVEAALRQQAETVDAAVRGQTEAVNAAVRGQIDSVDAAVREQTKAVEAAVRQQAETVDAAVRRHSEEVSSAVSAQLAKSVAAWRAQSEGLTAAVRQQAEALATAVREQSELIAAAWKGQSEALATAAREQAESSAATLKELSSAVHGTVRESSSSVTAALQRVAADIEETAGDSARSVTEAVTGLSGEITSTLDRFSDDVGAGLVERMDDLARKTAMFHERMLAYIKVRDVALEENRDEVLREMLAELLTGVRGKDREGVLRRLQTVVERRRDRRDAERFRTGATPARLPDDAIELAAVVREQRAAVPTTEAPVAGVERPAPDPAGSSPGASVKSAPGKRKSQKAPPKTAPNATQSKRAEASQKPDVSPKPKRTTEPSGARPPSAEEVVPFDRAEFDDSDQVPMEVQIAEALLGLEEEPVFIEPTGIEDELELNAWDIREAQGQSPPVSEEPAADKSPAPSPPENAKDVPRASSRRRSGASKPEVRPPSDAEEGDMADIRALAGAPSPDETLAQALARVEELVSQHRPRKRKPRPAAG